MRYALVLLLSLLTLAACGPKGVKDGEVVPVTIAKANGETVTFHAELAISRDKQRTGLMFRSAMAPDAGMLFLFPAEEMRAFWMRNTLIPLDMLFIRHDGLIVSIHKNAVPRDETPLPSAAPSNGVLEINGGRADELGIQPGDKVVHPFFKP